MRPVNNVFWSVLGRNQGQIVTEYQPQVAGASEGNEGRARGLRLFVDGSDKSWHVYRRGKLVSQGHGNPPTVQAAMLIKAPQLRRAFVDKRFSSC